ncbi:MAG: alkaline phosphatase family protein [Streptosporangiaceae bacterium]
MRAPAPLSRCKTGRLSDIKHVVILMQENRSFDHYFGTLPNVRGFADPKAITLPAHLAADGANDRRGRLGRAGRLDGVRGRDRPVLRPVVGRVRDHFSPAGPAPGAGAGLAGAHRLSRFPNFQ